VKRGVSNFIGELSKILLGIMDDDCAKYYDERTIFFEQNSEDMVSSYYDGVLGCGGTAPPMPRPRHQMKVSGQPHAPAAPPPGKEPPAPTGQEGHEDCASGTWDRVTFACDFCPNG
jgi:hypothetical protein